MIAAALPAALNHTYTVCQAWQRLFHAIACLDLPSLSRSSSNSMLRKHDCTNCAQDVQAWRSECLKHLDQPGSRLRSVLQAADPDWQLPSGWSIVTCHEYPHTIYPKSGAAGSHAPCLGP